MNVLHNFTCIYHDFDATVVKQKLGDNIVTVTNNVLHTFLKIFAVVKSLCQSQLRLSLRVVRILLLLGKVLRFYFAMCKKQCYQSLLTSIDTIILLLKSLSVCMSVRPSVRQSVCMSVGRSVLANCRSQFLGDVSNCSCRLTAYPFTSSRLSSA